MTQQKDQITERIEVDVDVATVWEKADFCLTSLASPPARRRAGVDPQTSVDTLLRLKTPHSSIHMLKHGVVAFNDR